MKALHKITAEYKELEKLGEEDPDMEIAVADTMEAIQGTFEDKATALATVMHNMESTEDMVNDEITRLTQRLSRMKNRRTGLVEYLRINMEASGIKKISCPLFTITCAMGREVVTVDDVDEIPDDFMSMPEVEMKPDKKAIMAALKDGAEVLGVHLERNKSSIRIK